MSANSLALASRASRMFFTAGRRRRAVSEAAAMCMAAGNVSLEDCDIFTSSLGWIGFLLPMTPPAISMARLEMTSLTFMLVCVPLPVCQTRRGKWPSSVPAMTSSAAREMRLHFSCESLGRLTVDSLKLKGGVRKEGVAMADHFGKRETRLDGKRCE